MIRRTRASLAFLAGAALLLAAACWGSDSGYCDNDNDSAAGCATTGLQLNMLIGSRGNAETKGVSEATSAWAQKGGNTVTVTPAKDLVQELTQALSGGT